jgi:hypothetical protein
VELKEKSRIYREKGSNGRKESFMRFREELKKNSGRLK